jgi:hypothetical protein
MGAREGYGEERVMVREVEKSSSLARTFKALENVASGMMLGLR